MAGYGNDKVNTYVGECFTLPVNALKQPLKGEGPAAGHYRPSGDSGGVSYIVQREGPSPQIQVVFRLRGTVHTQTLSVDTSAMPFGGRRFFWVCPRCEHTREKLYCPPRRALFACRGCLELTYESTGRSHSRWYEHIGRWANKLEALCEELDVEEPALFDLPLVPPRPKQMHRRTYRENLQQYWRLHRRVLRGVIHALSTGIYPSGSNDAPHAHSRPAGESPRRHPTGGDGP